MSYGVPPPQDVLNSGVFVQPLAPINNSLVASFFVGIIPLVLLLIFLGLLHLPAYIASVFSLFICLLISIFAWQMPAAQAFEAVGYGMVYANWPIMWIVVNSMYVYNITVHSGLFLLFRQWMLTNTPSDKRVLLIIIGFCFGALLEGVAGFGVPGAICSSMLVNLGFDPIDALVYTLIFNTTPVAFGALGTPVITLASVTGLPVMAISAMMGRQLPFASLFLPAYALLFYAGPRAGLLECWPLCIISGILFAGAQAIFANLVGPELPDLIAGLISLLGVIIFVQYWKPPFRPEYETPVNNVLSEHPHSSTTLVNESSINNGENNDIENTKTPDKIIEKPTIKEAMLAWSPWVIIVVIVIIWTFFKMSSRGQVHIEWPYLHQKVWLTLYGKKYDAVWNFQPLSTGTAILVSCSIFSVTIVLLQRVSYRIFYLAAKDTLFQLYKPVITVSFIIAFAYLYNYSGIVFTIGLTLSSVGRAFPFLSAWLGWIACFLSGSDTSANSLFGNLQVVAAREIGLSTILMAATNSSGAITSKMVSPQNLITGVSTIGLQGKEGFILRKTILHSIFMCCIMGAMSCIQQYLLPGMIPPGG
ncbi:lactate permease [Backusella circina FSU 941]|nr:lactate permease [Backusella circina FSU 941]